MALISCAECSKEISDKASSCPHCGAPQATGAVGTNDGNPSREKSSIWKWVLGVPVGGFVLIMIVGSCAGNTPDGREREASRGAISQCWAEQERKSLNPSVARTVAAACEQMEENYRKKWGTAP